MDDDHLPMMVTVGQVDVSGRRLRTMQIHIDTVATARAHGWWVFEDFEQQFIKPLPAIENDCNEPDEDGA